MAKFILLNITRALKGLNKRSITVKASLLSLLIKYSRRKICGKQTNKNKENICRCLMFLIVVFREALQLIWLWHK